MKRKILFYTSVDRNFRSTLLGYLIELQLLENVEIILLCEKFDTPLDSLLDSKSLFPKIVKKVYIGQYDSTSIYSFKNFLKLNKLAKEVVSIYAPSLVITTSDFHSIFELLICRYAKNSNTKVLSIACSTSPGDMKSIANWIRLYTLNTKYFKLYKHLAIVILFFRKHIAHYTVHYIFPVLSGIYPFIGKSSYLLYKGQSGMRNADYQIVFSEQEKNNFIKSGVLKEKIYVIRHPYSNEIAKNVLSSLFRNKLQNIDFLILHPAELIGFKADDFSLIDKEVRVSKNIALLKTIFELFPFSNVCIKLHPNVSSEVYGYVEKNYSSISERIIFIKHSEPIEALLLNSKVVIDFPRPVSTSIFMNCVLNPQKLSISVDIFNEFLGDYYKNNKCVAYINSIKDFNELLVKYKHGNILNQNSYADFEFDYDNINSFIIDKLLIA